MNWTSAGAGGKGGEGKRTGRKHGQQTFLTKGIKVNWPSGKWRAGRARPKARG